MGRNYNKRAPVVQGKKSLYFCFTINNPTMNGQQFIDHIRNVQLRNGKPYVDYCIFQKEKGASGTVHFQGMLKCSSQQRVTALQRKIATGAYFVMKGKPYQAADYCSKKDESYLEGPWSFGKIPKGQGNRADIKNLMKAVFDGKSDKYLFKEHTVPMVKYFKAVKYWRSLPGPCDRKFARQTIILWGHTGCGKTRAAKAMVSKPEDLYMNCVGKGVWLDGYEKHKAALIDEFSGNWPLDTVKRLLDPWSDSCVPIKHGYTWWQPHTIIITANSDPYTWWEDRNDMDKEAFFRRIDCILHYKRDGGLEETWNNTRYCEWKEQTGKNYPYPPVGYRGVNRPGPYDSAYQQDMQQFNV